MSRFTVAALAAGLLVAAAAAHAAPIVVDLSANATNPNAGTSSPGFTYNPVSETLAPGTYSVGVAGIAGGGQYDAYAVYAPTPSNGAFTDGNWSVKVGTTVQTQASTTRFNTAAAAESYYASLAPLTFTLTTATNVAFFYVDDTAFPYFGDDSGGVSLAINKVAVAVPEPMSLVLLGTSVLGLAMVRRRRA